MIDFACKTFNMDDIIKCGLGLTKAELKVMYYFIKHKKDGCNTISISKKLNLSLTTVQKAVKKLTNQNIIKRNQQNLNTGGYIFVYEVVSKDEIRLILKNIIRNWQKNVEHNIDKW